MNKEKQRKKLFFTQGKTTISDNKMLGHDALKLFEGIIKQINDVPSEYRDTVWVETHFEDGGGDYSPELELSVTYWRYETDEEYQARLDGEARMEKLRELKERQDYERLKEKYGDL